MNSGGVGGCDGVYGERPALLCSIRAAGAPEEPSWLLTMTSQMQSGTGPGPERVSLCLCVYVYVYGGGGERRSLS